MYNLSCNKNSLSKSSGEETLDSSFTLCRELTYGDLDDFSVKVALQLNAK